MRFLSGITVIMLILFVFGACLALIKMEQDIKDQNEILKSMLVNMQEQNKIFQYNPEEQSNETK